MAEDELEYDKIEYEMGHEVFPDPPHPKFRGVWMPPEVWEKLYTGEICAQEAIILLLVDSMCGKKRDCYAGNDYIGSFVGTKKSQTSEMVRHLKDLGLLVQTRFDGRRRFLACAWTRLVPSNQTSGKPESSVPENRKLYRPPTGDSSLSVAPDGDHDGETDSSRNGNILHPRWLKFATDLADAIASVRKINPRTKKSGWAQAFRRLHEVDKVPVLDIREVLRWYCSVVRQGDLIQDNSSYIPIAYSGATFREKFLRIQDAMERKRAFDRDSKEEKGPKIRQTVRLRSGRKIPLEEWKKLRAENPDDEEYDIEDEE